MRKKLNSLISIRPLQFILLLLTILLLVACAIGSNNATAQSNTAQVDEATPTATPTSPPTAATSGFYARSPQYSIAHYRAAISPPR